MPSSEEYERRVAGLESGEQPARPEDVCDLLSSIFTARWTTGEERDQAQRLICRLEVLRKCGKPMQRSEGRGAAI
jgi:hypothetical protein